MAPHVSSSAINAAVRSANQRERDPSVRLVGTGIAFGILALAAHAFGRLAEGRRAQ